MLGTDVDSHASGELSAVGAGRALEKGGLVVDARDGTVRWFGVTAGATGMVAVGKLDVNADEMA